MITKIQSFTDLITNSSSTVFVMNKPKAKQYTNLPNTYGCISMIPITFDWLLERPWEVAMVCDMIDVDPATISTYDEEWDLWKTPSDSLWEVFINQHKEKIEEVFKDLYWVNIEDHFEDAYEVIKDADNDAEWSDCRH